jgi:hypothetical protein
MIYQTTSKGGPTKKPTYNFKMACAAACSITRWIGTRKAFGK